MKTALTIAGSDPTGGAGFQADLRTFKSMGIHGLSVPSVLTAQNTEGVFNVHGLPADFIESQLDIVLKDIVPDAVKTGMLYNSDIVGLVAEKIRQYSLKNLVIDPVTISSTGVRLLEAKGLEIMKKELIPKAMVITPNIHEASALSGIEIKTESSMKNAAVKLREYGPRAVIITGGHLEGKAEDLLFDGDEFFALKSEMLKGEFHGTGCVFSSVITACLAMDLEVKEAFARAKDFVRDAMMNAFAAGKGMKILDI